MSVSLRLTHKITAIGIIGVVGVILTGGIHFYGESAMAASTICRNSESWPYPLIA